MTSNSVEYDSKLIENNFLHITHCWDLLYRFSRFEKWANIYQKNKKIEDLISEYELSYKSTYENQKNNLFDFTTKMRENFQDEIIKKLMVSDVYSLKIFGRTKVAKQVMFAKQVGDMSLISILASQIKPKLSQIMKVYKIDSIAFVPPTVPRPIQFIVELKKLLESSVREVEILKVLGGDIPVPQKTLSSLAERVVNASKTLFLKESKQITSKNILIIDDVVGSGAWFH